MNLSIQQAAKHPLPALALRNSGALLLLLALAACGGDGGDNSQLACAPIFDDHGKWVTDTCAQGSGGGEPLPSQVVMCKDHKENDMEVEPKTISVYNNSESTVYPVLATSKNAENEWIQGCFRTTTSYPTKFVYKLYVNEGQGIPPNSSVTITLPLFSELPAELSKDRYITWWNGGRVVLADDGERLRDNKDKELATPVGVTCEGEGTACALSTYSSDVQFPENIYAQLSEYTFGDSIIVPTDKDPKRLLKPENVGYNISYVDHVYMPVAIGLKNNPYIGYSGSVQPLAAFANQLAAFLASPAGKGWPVYNLSKLKLPGGYNIFAQRSGTLPPDDNVPVKPPAGFPPVLTVLQCINGGCTDAEKASLHFGDAVQRMQNLWGTCVAWPGENLSAYVTEDMSAICTQDLKDNLAVVKLFFQQNHKDYLAMHGKNQCNSTTPQVPTFNYWNAIMHIYGWVPFNQGCGAAANPLSETKIPGWDHERTQSMYIHDLQYNHTQDRVKANPKLLFNPYVQLIHDDLEMNAYAFSVDDAVGFMSELGDGLIFAVGGTRGLENQKQFNYADGFSLMIGVPQSLKEDITQSLIKRYGICVLNQDDNDLDCQVDKQNVEMPDNSQIAGFRVGTVASYPIKVRFTDLDDNVYSFRVNTKFACPDGTGPAECPTNGLGIVDQPSCQVINREGKPHANSKKWCEGANPNQKKEKQLTKNYLSFPQPVDFM